MEFYKASYTSLKGSVTDFIVPVDRETTLIKNVVSSAFKQLRMLQELQTQYQLHSNVVSDTYPPFDEIVVSVELNDDHVPLMSRISFQNRKYYITSDLGIPPNVSHFYFSHVSPIPFGIIFVIELVFSGNWK